jgi:hypothetical protein
MSPPAKTDKAIADTQFRTDFKELLEGCNDWSARLIAFCESFWGRLEQENDIPPDFIHAFVTLLNDESNEAFQLAMLVIPEFRDEPAPQLKSLGQQQVMKDTQQIRAKHARLCTTKQAQFDDALYKEEKRIFDDTDIYRAGLLLYKTGRLTPEQKKAVED